MTDLPFWHPAEPRKQIWRTALGLVLIMGLWLVGSFAVFYAAAIALGLPLWRVAQGNTPLTAAVFFSSFIWFHVGLALALRLLHRRRYRSLFGPAGRLHLPHLWRGAGVTLAIAIALYALLAVEHLVLPEGVPPRLRQNLPLGLWAASLLPAVALIFLQTFAEEAVFRGYLLQQLRARFRSPLIWALAPSLLFGLLHFAPDTYGYVNAAGYVLNATVMGMIAAFVTLRTGNLGATAGLHFGNNVVLVLIGPSGTVAGFSLFTVGMDPQSGYATYSILSQTAVMALVFALWWRWMGRHRPIANASDAP